MQVVVETCSRVVVVLWKHTQVDTMPIDCETYPPPAELEEPPQHPVAAKPPGNTRHDGDVQVFCTRLRNQV